MVPKPTVGSDTPTFFYPHNYGSVLLGDYENTSSLATKKPWIIGLIDGLSAANLIRSSSIAHKNRFAFIVLDSTLEIAFKSFLVNEKKISTIPESQWKFREKIIKIMKKNVNFEKELWSDINYFYNLRVGLYHEDAEKTVIDETVNNFQELVEFVIDKLFGVESSTMVPLTQSLLPLKESTQEGIPINSIPEKINVLVVAVGESESKDPNELSEFLEKKGLRGKLLNNTMGVYLNNTMKHLFYFDDYWKLSDEGKNRYETLRKSYVTHKEQDNNE